MNNITIQTIEEMKYNELKKVAAGLKVKFIGVKHEVLKANVIATLGLDQQAVTAEKKVKEEKPVSEVARIIAGDDTHSKSARIRKMLEIGMERKEVAKAMNVRYQMVRNIAVKMTELQ